MHCYMVNYFLYSFKKIEILFTEDWKNFFLLIRNAQTKLHATSNTLCVKKFFLN